MAKATRVQAANAIPCVANTVAENTVRLSCARNGWKNQTNTWLNAPATAVTATASSASLAMVHRSRPKPCVQAYRKVPVSSSLASTGAPANAPIRAGVRFTKMLMVFAIVQSVPLKLLFRAWQAFELNGWQAVRTA